MLILKTTGWQDYQLLDSGDGQRLERFGKYTLIRPDPQVIWKQNLPSNIWNKADAIFQKYEKDQGKWVKKRKIPDQWKISYNNLVFYCKLTSFKHTGVFPEQKIHWDFISEIISTAAVPAKEIKILNLFGYTGIASLAAAFAGAKVTHVDASYQAIFWARENQELSSLEKAPIRWILDDCLKFVNRELKRDNKYDGIIMDPPIYGHGPKGEKWDFNSCFPKLMQLCSKLLSTNPLFVIINAYAISSSAIMLENVLTDCSKNLGGKIESGELALEEKRSKRLLSTGIFARWQR